MFKKILSMVVCVCVALCAIASVAFAGEFKTEDEKTFYYDDTNNIVVGWFSIENEDGTTNWFFAAPDGEVQSGFVMINNQLYYFDPETFAMATSAVVVDDIEYVFGEDGIGDASTVDLSSVANFTITEGGDVVDNVTEESAPVTSPKPF